MTGTLTFRRSRGWTLVVAVALSIMGLVPAASAVAPPTELRYVCVDQQDDVVFVAAPSDCGAKEDLVTLPDDAPTFWCIDHLGRLKAVVAPTCRRGDTLTTIPDDGPVFVCARIVQGGELLTRGPLRRVLDLSQCTTHELGFVTPAAPEGVGDTYTTDEDTVLEVPAKGVLDNDRDLTGQPLTAQLVSGPGVGVFALQNDGSFRFDPRGVFDDLDEGESRTVTFRYRADDGALVSGATTVNLVVTGRNDRPRATDDVLTTTEDSVLDVLAPGVLGNDSDAEGHPLTAEVVDGPDQGALSLDATGGLRFDPRADFQHLGAAPGDDGTSTFTYVARDGSVASDAATVTIRVTGVNDVPLGGNDDFQTDENTPLIVTPAQLLGNDTDAEGSPLSVADIVFPTSGSGTLTTLSDGSFRFDPTVDTGDADSAPDFDHLGGGQSATVELAYRADDGELRSAPVTVRIVVHGISAPTANDDVAETDEDHAVALDLFANDQLEDGSLTLDTAGTGGTVSTESDGVVRYDPRGAFDGLAAGTTATDTFGYVLSNDEGTSTGSVHVLVRGVNDAPVALPDSYDVVPGTVLDVPAGAGLLANDDDFDSTSLTVRLVAPPDLGRLTLRSDGGFTFDPAGDFDETHTATTFSYRTGDGSLESATTSVTLDVGSNDAPTFGSPTYNFRVLVTAVAGTVVGTVQATDPDGDELKYDLVETDSSAFQLDSASGQITVGPDGPPSLGSYVLAVAVSDGHGGSDQARVTVVVVPELNAVDDEFAGVGNTQVVGGTPPDSSYESRAVVRVASLLVNDGGTTGSVVPFEGTLASGAHVRIWSDGSFVYTPPVAGGAAWDGVAPLSDEFGYTLEGEGVVDAEGLVSLTLTTPVWYVDNAVASAGSGTAWDPFGSLADVSGTTGPDLPGHLIFLFGHADDPGTSEPEHRYAGGIGLLNEQHLVGEGAGLTVEGIAVAPAGAAPRIDGTTTAPAVAVASDNVLAGFTVGGSGAGLAGPATGVGALRADLQAVESAGSPLDLVAGGAVAAVGITLGTVSSSGGGVLLEGLAGMVSIATVELSSGHGLDIVAGEGQVDLGSVDVGPGRVSISDNAGTIHVASLGATQTGGLDVVGNTGDVAVDTVTLAQLSDGGILVEDEHGTTVVGDGSVSGDSEALTGSLLRVAGGSDGSITIGADLTLTPADGTADAHSGRAVDITGVVTGGEVTVSGDLRDRGLGVLVHDTEGIVRLTGAVDVATDDSEAFAAHRVGGLEVSPVGSRKVVLTSAAASTLVLDSVRGGPAGARFDRVDSLPLGTAPAYGIDLAAVSSEPGPGIVIGSGKLQSPGTAGVHVQDATGVTLRSLVIESSAGDGIVIEDSRGVVVSGTQVQQPEAVGFKATGSGDVQVTGSTVSAAGSYGIALRDLDGRITLSNAQVQGSRNTQLLVVDGTAGVTGRDEVLLESSVFSGGEPEDDSISVLATDDDPATDGAADLLFRVAGSTPSGSIGGDRGLDATAEAGASLTTDLTRFAVANTARDGIRLDATDSGSRLDFSFTKLDTTGGGGVQLTGGAGVRVTGDGQATIGGSLDQVAVTRTIDTGIVLDRVAGVTMDVVAVSAAERHAVAITRSSDVSVDQLDVLRPSRHGLYVDASTNIGVDDSRFDLRPAPFVPEGETARFSAVWMQHLGGDLNAVTDTTLRGSTGDELVVLEGGVDGEPVPAGVPTTATVNIAGLTATDTAIDADTSDDLTPDGDAVRVVAGSGGALTVDLSGALTRTDETVKLSAESGGTMRVVGGHRIEHRGADSLAEAEDGGIDDSVVLQAEGAGSNLTLEAVGLSAVQVAPDDLTTTVLPGHALDVRALSGGTVTPATAGQPSLSDGTVVSLGADSAVQFLADEMGSTLDVRADGLDVSFELPAPGTSTADAISVLGTDGGSVTHVQVAGSTLVPVGGAAFRSLTLGTFEPQPFPLPPIIKPEGTIGQVVVEEVNVPAGGADGIVTQSGECVSLVANDTTNVAGVGYVLDGVRLAGLQSGESAAAWLTRLGNAGPPGSRYVTDGSIGGCTL